MNRKLFCAVLILICTLFCLTLPAAAEDTDILSGVSLVSEEEDRFFYKHDPCLNPDAMKDILVDPTAVYGFRPDPASTRLGAYADFDWSDLALIIDARAERVAYHESMKELYDLEASLAGAGADIETIARAVSARRNELRLQGYENNPEGLAALKESNLAAYGNENGPTADSLFEKYGSWETVLSKAFSVNSGMDACLGLYDDYYGLYCMIGQVDDPAYLYDMRIEATLDAFLETLDKKPDAHCTRSQTVAMLWFLSLSPKPVSEVPAFADAAADAWYFLPVQWAAEAAVTFGTGNGLFSPDADVTRGQLVTLMMRSAGGQAESSECVFTDVSRDDYCFDAVIWAYENGITFGTSETTFDADAVCSFREASLFLSRYIDAFTIFTTDTQEDSYEQIS